MATYESENAPAQASQTTDRIQRGTTDDRPAVQAFDPHFGQIASGGSHIDLDEIIWDRFE